MLPAGQRGTAMRFQGRDVRHWPLALGALALAGCAHHGRMTMADLAALDGTAYYLFAAGHTCTGPHGGPAQASWTDKVEVIDGKLVRWGTRCTGEGLPVPAAERATARFSADHRTLDLGGHTYRQSADPVREAGGQP